jgi:hypothetical protein
MIKREESEMDVTEDETSARAKLRDTIEDAALYVSTINATDPVGVVIGAVVAKLHADPRMPRYTRNQWDEIQRDPLLDAEDIYEVLATARARNQADMRESGP